jgi:hypothetical protein
MTHCPNIDVPPPRRGKMVTSCGKVVSIRKAVTIFPSCPACITPPLDVLWKDLDTSVRDLIDRSAFIRANRVLSRKRWRRA